MKFKELFQDVEDWFWKLEFNPETNSYELYLGIPNDWVYSQKNGSILIELVHELEENSIIKIYTDDDNITVDDIIDISKLLISKNQELEKRKEAHRLEMEKLKDMLIEKEKNFLEYVDKVKDNTISDAVSDAVFDAVRTVANKVMNTPNLSPVDGVSDGLNDGVSDGVENDKGKQFIEDIEKLKLT
jgi:hypothetical protein